MLRSIPSSIARDIAGYMNSDPCFDCRVQVAHVEPKGLFCGSGCCQAFIIPNVVVGEDVSCQPLYNLVLELVVDVCGPTLTENGVEFVDSHVDLALDRLFGMLQVFNSWFGQEHVLPSSFETSCNDVVDRKGWKLIHAENNCYRFKASVTISL